MNMKEPVTELGRRTLKTGRDLRFPSPFQIRLRPLCRQEVDETTKFFVFFFYIGGKIETNIHYSHTVKHIVLPLTKIIRSDGLNITVILILGQKVKFWHCKTNFIDANKRAFWRYSPKVKCQTSMLFLNNG